MKQLLLTTIAAVLLVGCGNPEADRALHDAARKGNIYAVKQHLAAGADVNVKHKSGSTPLDEATVRGYKEVVELLIAEGADVNGPTKWGSTPLSDAAGGGHKKIVELLIAEGADVNAKNKRGKTPLDWAKRHPETADLLRKHGGKTGEELKAEAK